MTESLIGSMSIIGRLRVISPSSAARYRSTDKSLRRVSGSRTTSLGFSLIDADRDGTTRWFRSPAMTIPTCPVCLGTAVAFLATPSDRSVVDYYRCACGHVWTADKVDQSVVTHVTPLPTLRPTLPTLRPNE